MSEPFDFGFDAGDFTSGIGDFANSVTSGIDPSALAGVAGGFDWSSINPIGDIGNLFGGGGGGGGIDWNSVTPMDPVSPIAPTSVVNPNSFDTTGLITPGSINFGGGGFTLPPGVNPASVARAVGGGGNPGNPAAPQPATRSVLPGQPGAAPGAAPGGVPRLPGAAPGGGGLIPNLINTVTGGGGNSFADILASGGLLASLLQKNGLPPQADALQKQADYLGQQGKNELATAQANQQGNINDQALGRVERSLRKQQAGIRKSYADMGLSGSTMEAQDLNDASQAADQEVFAVGQQMATTGLNASLTMFGDQSGIMQNLLQDQIEQDRELSDAMAQFAAAAVRYDGTANVQQQPGQTGGGVPATSIPGTPPGTTPQDIVNQIAGVTSNPIDPSLLLGPITPMTPLDPAVVTQVPNVDPSQFIPLPDFDTMILGKNDPADLSYLDPSTQGALGDFTGVG